MEKVLLKTPGILVPYTEEIHGRSVNFTAGNLKTAVEFMIKHDENKLICSQIWEFYQNGMTTKHSFKEDFPVFIFGEKVTRQEALNLLQKNAKISIPDDFSSSGQKFVFCERLNRIETWDEKSVVLSENAIQAILRNPAQDYSKRSQLSVYHDKAYVLGCGLLELSNVYYSLGEALNEFRNNLDDYSFIKVYNLEYYLNGTSAMTLDKYIFRSDRHMNVREALLSSGSKEKIKKLAALGYQDYIYDNKYDSVEPAPENSYFADILNILRWQAN